MAYSPLYFEHPRTWLETLPDKTWDRARRVYVFTPTHIRGLSSWYRHYLKSAMVSDALRYLNLQWSPDDDTLANLTHFIEQRTISAGRKVGVVFTPGASKPRHIIDGELSREWVARASRAAARFALEVWDPATAQRLHDRAVAMGKKSSRLKVPVSVADLARVEGMSISISAKILGCSTRHVSYLRAEQKGAA